MTVFPGTAHPAPRSMEQRVADGKAGVAAPDAIFPFPHLSEEALPIPEGLRDGGAIQKEMAAGFRLTARHAYRSADGDLLAIVARMENEKGAKTFRPICHYGTSSDGFAIYRTGFFAKPRPLYNLPAIVAQPDRPILLVEGEKTADAAAIRFGDVYVVATWPGGAKGVGAVDLAPLSGRDVTVWPDNDKDGHDGAQKMAGLAYAAGARSVRMVAVPDTYPAKYDLADPDPDGMVDDMAPAVLLAAAELIDPASVRAAPRQPQPKAVAPRPKTDADIVEGFRMMRFLQTVGVRNYAERGDWIDSGMIAKNSFGEAGFDPWVELSVNEGGGTDSEEEYRRVWDSFGDRPPGEGLTMGTIVMQAREAGYEAEEGSGGGSGGGGGGSRADPAAFVLEQCEAEGDLFWLDQYGKAHVSMSVPVAGEGGASRVVHLRVGGRRHVEAVSGRYIAAKGNKVLSKEQQSRAMVLLEHRARESGDVFESCMRVGQHGGTIYVDLGRQDGKVARVDAEGYAVTEECPVRFVRGSRGEMPLPLPGGTRALFETHLNLSGDDLTRAIAFCLGALAPLPSFPLLLIEGRHGSAKSTIGDMCLMLCDPPLGRKAGRIKMPRGQQNLFVHAAKVRVAFIDNASDISADEADALCVLATGGAVSSRQNYTDDEEMQINAVRPVILTCIGTPTGRGDFLDRCLRVTADPIEKRKTEEAVFGAFEADAPRMLDYLLTALSVALRNRADVQQRMEDGTLPLARMADFSLFVEAAAEALGLEPSAFSTMLRSEQSSMQSEAALGDPLGRAIYRYLASDSGRLALDGYAVDVLSELAPLVDAKDLPASNKLKGALCRIEAGLTELGIAFDVRPETGTRAHRTRYRIVRTDAFDAEPMEQHF